MTSFMISKWMFDSQIKTLDVKVESETGPNNTITPIIRLCDDNSQPIAKLTKQGLICDQDRFKDKSTKDFAADLFLIINKFAGNHDFKGGQTHVKFMVDGDPALTIGERDLAFTSFDEMTMFDQWVAWHLEQMWKGRRA